MAAGFKHFISLPAGGNIAPKMLQQTFHKDSLLAHHSMKNVPVLLYSSPACGFPMGTC